MLVLKQSQVYRDPSREASRGQRGRKISRAATARRGYGLFYVLRPTAEISVLTIGVSHRTADILQPIRVCPRRCTLTAKKGGRQSSFPIFVRRTVEPAGSTGAAPFLHTVGSTRPAQSCCKAKRAVPPPSWWLQELPYSKTPTV